MTLKLQEYVALPVLPCLVSMVVLADWRQHWPLAKSSQNVPMFIWAACSLSVREFWVAKANMPDLTPSLSPPLHLHTRLLAEHNSAHC